MNKVYCYPRCTTCKKAVKWLEENGIDYEYKHIVEETPSKEDIKKYYKESGLPLKRFFNTSGNVYKELNLKEKLAEMSEDEQFELLASNGMVLKRPLWIIPSGTFESFMTGTTIWISDRLSGLIGTEWI